MTPDARYSDYHWQIEHKIAELVGEQRLLGFEIQQRTTRLYQVNQEIELLQSELRKHQPGEPS